MSWPGRSQISQTSSPLREVVPDITDSDRDDTDDVMDGKDVLESSGRPVLEDFLWLFARRSCSRETSRSSSS